MKLWFKIFISSIFLVIAAVNITAAAVLSNNQNILITRERSRQLSNHEYICASIKNKVIYERLKSDRFLLDDDDIRSVINKSALNQFQNISVVIKCMENNSNTYTSGKLPDTSALEENISDENNIVSTITDNKHRSYILAGSKITLEGKKYIIITAADISEIYAERDRELIFIQIISVLCAATVAVVLLVIIYVFLRPLGRINASIKEIADGNYDKRLEYKGSEEFSLLSRNINTMAEAVEKNYKRIESVAYERKRFIDSLSHEIKTPLTSILGFADILRIKRAITPEELNEYSSIIVEEAKHLRSLSEKLMELVSAGNGDLDLRPVRADMLLGELQTVFIPIMKTKSITLSCRLEKAVINADEDIFKSLIYNLIDNAFKASSEGSVIELYCESNSKNVTITVKDHGIGIADEDKKRIFEPFYMADKSRSRKQGGAGLGLALCAEIAKKHGAKLELESEPGKGTAIRVIIRSAGGEINEN